MKCENIPAKEAHVRSEQVKSCTPIYPITWMVHHERR